MNLKDWAKNEVELAIKRENPDWDGKSFDYGIACYKSALKAYNSLLSDNHSGMSWSITKIILERLIDGLPLKAIEDKDFVKGEQLFYPKEISEVKSSTQCKRMSSLFKKEYRNGTVKYYDVERTYCFELDDNKNTYRNGMVSEIIDEMFPITMPYYPPKGKYKVCCETFLYDERNGDFDTRGVLYVITPSGEKVEINRYFIEKEGTFVETTKEEYDNRKEVRLCIND